MIRLVLQGCSPDIPKNFGATRGFESEAKLCCTVMLSGMESKRRLYVEMRIEEEVVFAARRVGPIEKDDMAL